MKALSLILKILGWLCLASGVMSFLQGNFLSGIALALLLPAALSGAESAKQAAGFSGEKASMKKLVFGGIILKSIACFSGAIAISSIGINILISFVWAIIALIFFMLGQRLTSKVDFTESNATVK